MKKRVSGACAVALFFILLPLSEAGLLICNDVVKDSLSDAHRKNLEEPRAVSLRGYSELTQPVKLRGSVMNYAWGGFHFIPDLLGIDNPQEKPFAEFWVGVHKDAPSQVETSHGQISLKDWIGREPRVILGSTDAGKFPAGLPYLFKVLDVKEMLSIQVHPNRKQAGEGFERENRLGIPLDSPVRNYKDENHKPEEHIALSEFWMLHSFRELQEIADLFETMPEFKAMTHLESFRAKVGGFQERLEAADSNRERRKDLLRDLYEYVMSDKFMSQQEVNAVLNQLLERLPQDERELNKDGPDFWAVRAARTFSTKDGNRDRSLFSIYFLNLIHLHPGQSTYQAAGVLHAYLEGKTVELMSNSNNVLRGGLTPKHVDPDELLKVVSFESGRPKIMNGLNLGPAETAYKTPSEEFTLSKIIVSSNIKYIGQGNHGIDTFIVLDGQAEMQSGSKTYPLSKGTVFMVPAGTPYQIISITAATVFRATIPQ